MQWAGQQGGALTTAPRKKKKKTNNQAYTETNDLKIGKINPTNRVFECSNRTKQNFSNDERFLVI